MADEKKTPEVKVGVAVDPKPDSNKPIAPDHPIAPDKEKLEKIVVTKSAQRIMDVVKAGGATPESVDNFKSEVTDAVLTELSAIEDAGNADNADTLSKERADHAATLRQALGSTEPVEPSEDELKAIEDRAKVMREQAENRDPEADARAEARPANWHILERDGDNIKAVNNLTGKEYEGDIKGLIPTEKK